MDWKKQNKSLSLGKFWLTSCWYMCYTHLMVLQTKRQTWGTGMISSGPQIRLTLRGAIKARSCLFCRYQCFRNQHAQLCQDSVLWTQSKSQGSWWSTPPGLCLTPLMLLLQPGLYFRPGSRLSHCTILWLWLVALSYPGLLQLGAGCL